MKSGKVMKFISKNFFPLAVSFCVSAIVAGTGVLTYRFSQTTGKGGFESPAAPKYSQKIESLSETLSESEEVSEKNAPVTYFTYRIKSGDMIGFIAEEYGVTQDTLISVNNIRATRFIQPGQYIKIPSMPGILYTVKKDGETPQSVSEKYDVDAVQTAMANRLETDTELKVGSSIFVPNGEMDDILRAEINGDLFKKPIHTRFRISSYFGWRPSPFTGRRSWHGGIDMACPQWTNIYAAMPGRVIKVAYSNTYGNYVIIQHHSGYQTLYGHMVQQKAKVGDYVDTSSVIGYVGSTGQSTGPHCHFTVFKNGKMVNPFNLWG